MPRAYTLATTALALDTSSKWLDNILSHHKLAGVVQEKQGVSRRITIDGLLTLSLVLLLTAELGITAGAAVSIAQTMIAEAGRFESPNGLILSVDLDSLRNRLLSRLERAVEVAPLPRRGRPPKNRTGRLE